MLERMWRDDCLLYCNLRCIIGTRIQLSVIWYIACADWLTRTSTTYVYVNLRPNSRQVFLLLKYHPNKHKTFYITFVQRRPNVFDVGPTLYKCYTNVLCFLGFLLLYAMSGQTVCLSLPSVTPSLNNIAQCSVRQFTPPQWLCCHLL